MPKALKEEEIRDILRGSGIEELWDWTISLIRVATEDDAETEEQVLEWMQKVKPSCTSALEPMM